MSEYWKKVELEEGVPVVYLAVYALRWQPEWGEPSQSDVSTTRDVLMDIKKDEL
jgi:hypothetical protein